jgi:hypothetical protein
MSNQIATMFSQVFGKKVTLKAQQGYGKKKVQSIYHDDINKWLLKDGRQMVGGYCE